MAKDPKDSSTAEATAATNPDRTSTKDSHHSENIGEAAIAATATDDDVEPQNMTNSPDESPLKIPFFLPRPPTPPPSTAPCKLTQLPNSIPLTTRDFDTLASKESFASLIRNRLPDPDPSVFRLNDPAKSSEELPSPSLPNSNSAGNLGKRSGTGSMGVLMSVVNSAKNRRRREAAAGSTASEEEPSEGEQTGGETGESVSIGSGSEMDRKARDDVGGKKEKKKKKRVREGKRRELLDGEGEGKGEGEGEGKQPEERRKRERRRNLWEEL